MKKRRNNRRSTLRVDWKEFENRLYIASRKAIKNFATKQPHEEVCYFAFDSEPRYGYVLICFNTTEESIKSVVESQQFALKLRKEMIRGDALDWKMAETAIATPGLLPFCNNTGDFKYQGYAEVPFPEWAKMAERADYPKKVEDWDEDYLEGNALIIFWRVIERLAKAKAFDRLRLSSPFLAGYGFHDKNQVILRILNLSQTETATDR